MTKRFRHALVLGKFYPLHAGHSALIRAANAQSARTTVQVLASSVESIPLDVRAEWVQQEHPEVRVEAAMDEAEVDFESAAAWDAHMALIVSLLDEPVDAVFTSDEYGVELARRLDATWVQLDPGRVATPVSGTAVRADVAGHWWALSAAVRSWFVRRVVVLGAESTGTTTLALALADRFATSWVPEFGREWSEVRPGGLAAPWHTAEFDLVAREQARVEDAEAAKTPVPLLICDTDVLATAVWHERYVGSLSPTVEALAKSRVPDLYILTGDEIPFVQDGLRDGEHVRPWMTERFREVLSGQPAPWIEVRGSRAERLDISADAVSKLVNGGWHLNDPLG
ncbi:cytidyltransferase [Knoellia sinensis KCTC 19936]|uniref:Cytidyltransferase n=1 Tax=Knoellia sinensis KCTC 19936 TaxID=1385520 RepID=A0A0A0J4K8_9MICO|nr:AAA family ATPase [Knoellia sinensis]KGN30531.1 cytidyltransferase [Knoellia sinensis KCTC 19936]